MNRLYIDTNIILDLLAERIPFYNPAAKLASLADKKAITLVASPVSFATAYYILSKFENADAAREKLRKFKIITEICPIDDSVIEKGLNSPFPDFEDSLQYHCAVDSGCDLIITRNAKDFKHSLIPVLTAEEYLKSNKPRLKND